MHEGVGAKHSGLCPWAFAEALERMLRPYLRRSAVSHCRAAWFSGRRDSSVGWPLKISAMPLTCHLGRSGAGRIHLPAATQGFVQGDEVDDHGHLALGQCILARIEGPLGKDHVQEIGQPARVPLVG
jgi:hypothetical protein